jgi:DNA-binding transcriptional regulator/RsmH inhibitor MraZ
LHTYSREAEVNQQGKLLVPKDWSEAAGLPTDDQVVLAGRGKFFEIWNRDNFAQMEARIQAELAPLIADLGIF